MISNSFKIQTIVYGWSYFLPMKLYLKFWVIPTSFDPVLPSGYKSAPLRDKVFDFLEKNQNHCPSFCAASHQVFYWKIMPKNVQNTKKNMSNRKIRKRSKNATNRALEIWVAGFWRKSIFGSFSHFQAIWPLWFSENHLFGARNPSIFNNITDSPSNALKLSSGQPRKHTFCPTDREINRTDGAGPLATINVWNYMIIWQQLMQEVHRRSRLPTYKKTSITFRPFTIQTTPSRLLSLSKAVY